jgi:hypothetical protein
VPNAGRNETRGIEEAEQPADEFAAALGRTAVGQASGEAITSMSNAYRNRAPDYPGRYAAGQRASTPGGTEGEAAPFGWTELPARTLSAR